MKAIIWKEFRENAKWGTLGLAFMVLAVLGVLYDFRVNVDYPKGTFNGEIFVLNVFSSGCIAFALGLLQSVLEIRRNQWAFLMHRGISATRIFLGKALAGLILYLLVMLVPLLVAIVCFSMWSPQQMLFDWRMILANLAVILAGAGLYFAGMLIAMRQARIYVSRLFPAALPVGAYFLVIAYLEVVSEVVPVWLFAVVLLVVVCMGLAAWGIFVRSGESVGLPAASKVALGSILTITWSVVMVGVVCFLVAGTYKVLGKIGWYPPSESQYHYALSQDGHILRAQVSWSRAGQLISDVSDLGDASLQQPAGTIEALNREKTTASLDSQIYNQAIGHIEMASVYYDGDAFIAQWWRRSGRQHLSQQVQYDRSSAYFFSTLDGLIYEYNIDRHDTQGRGLPPQLVSIIGSDGRHNADDMPVQGFGKSVLSSLRPHFLSASFILSSTGVDGQERFNQQYLLFDRGIFKVDYDTGDVTPIYSPPTGEKLRQLVQIDKERLAVVLEDAIEIRKSTSDVIGEWQDDNAKTQRELRVEVPGELISVIPLPNELRPFDVFEFAQVPGRDDIVFRCRNTITDMVRFITTKKDGEVLAVRDFPALPPRGLNQRATVFFSILALLIPIAPALLGLVIDSVIHISQGAGPGILQYTFMNDPVAYLPALTILVGLAVVSLMLAKRTARRYGFGNSERRSWMIVSFLLGPAGLLALYCLRPWPSFEQCAVCGEARPVDMDFCQRCKSAVEPVHLDGTEILQDAAAMAV